MEKLFKNNIIGEIGKEKYYAQIQWRNGVITMDEPISIGGKDLGPDPYTTLAASLAGCTLSTLRMYIDRKGWDISNITVSLNMYQEQNPLTTIIERHISFSQEIPDEIKERLMFIASKCPVSKILENNIKINTTL